jgi:hypothetical protein
MEYSELLQVIRTKNNWVRKIMFWDSFWYGVNFVPFFYFFDIMMLKLVYKRKVCSILINLFYKLIYRQRSIVKLELILVLQPLKLRVSGVVLA